MSTHLRLRIDFIDFVDFANFDNFDKDVHCCSHSHSFDINCFNKHLNEIKSRIKMLIEINFVKTIFENCINHVL